MQSKNGNMKQSEVGNMKRKGGQNFGDGWVNRIITMTDGMDDWSR